MIRNPALPLALLALVLVVALTIACGPGSAQNGDASPAVPTSEPPTPADAAAIRNVDFAQVAAVQNFMRQIGGGEIDRQAVKYADLTRDGRDDAIVPISSGGTLGNLGYVVLTLRSGTPAAILMATRDRNSIGGVNMAFEDGKLVKYIGKYAAEDARCCPSALLRTQYYWDGTNLQVEREDEIKQTGQKQ